MINTECYSQVISNGLVRTRMLHFQSVINNVTLNKTKDFLSILFKQQHYLQLTIIDQPNIPLGVCELVDHLLHLILWEVAEMQELIDDLRLHL